MPDHDSPWKEALDVYFELFMAFFFPEAYAAIDWQKGYEALDKELQQIAKENEVGRRYVDKLVKVWLKNGQEQWLLLHVEVQMTEQTVFPARMFTYNYRLRDKHNQEVISLAVLGDDNPTWHPDRFTSERWGFRMEMKFPVVKLLDYADKIEHLERHENLFALIVVAHLRTLETRDNPRTRKEVKVQLVKSLYSRGLSANNVRQLFRVIDWIIELQKPLEFEFLEEVESFEKETIMPYITTPERCGEELGLIQGMKLTIERTLVKKFGEDGLRLFSEIRGVYDKDKLLAIHDAAVSATSVAEVQSLL